MNFHDRDTLEWMHEAIEDGRSPFWRYVDGAHDGRSEWAALRDGQCLATTAHGRRCSYLLEDGFPFCQHHTERASLWLHAVQTRAAVTYRAGDYLRVLNQAQNIIDSHGDSRVYFYELEGAGLVKIGTSRRVETRISSFRAGKGCTWPEGADPATGHLLGTTPGGHDLERHLHGIYRRERVIGEWFRLTEPLADDIARMITARTSCAHPPSRPPGSPAGEGECVGLVINDREGSPHSTGQGRDLPPGPAPPRPDSAT